ncbi:MAG: glutamate synthase subunit alpha, partial [Clostridia bacterium]|nr:glutamate synthase subunit alpha [Clostridia bacterium]
MKNESLQNNLLYREQFEHDACGIGTVVSINGTASRRIVDSALQIVEKLEHRAGKDAAGETGDGVGIIVATPHQFFKKAAADCGIALGDARSYGVGMLFLPQNDLHRAQAKKMLEIITAKEGLKFLGWRTVPTDPGTLGQKAIDKMPYIEQCFIEKPEDCATGIEFDRKLYVIRRVFEQSNDNSYVCSLSSRTIVYKGMFLVHQLRSFYQDLQSEEFISTIAMVHSRFSTNTNPSWERAHPNRFIVHNGEINTIRGNADRMLARGETMDSPFLNENYEKILPVVDISGSDSAMLDNTLEFLVMNGMELPLAMMICVPEPWKSDDTMSRAKKDMYHYYSTMMEPWDGPAALLFTDGDQVGACLDRNGLRPSRYYITDDDLLILSSEVGVLPLEDKHIVKKSRLQPGKMLLIDTVKGRIVSDDELKEYYANRHPYGEWLDMHLKTLHGLPIPNKKVEESTQEVRDRLYKAFGYSYEDINTSIIPMAKNGSEPIAAMGIDIPLAVLSEKHQLLFSYFKQLFAQVTNPPIDAIREEIITDTQVYVGSDGNLLEDKEDNCQVLEIQ